MKKIAYTLTLFSVFAFADLSVQQIEQMVAKIHEKREGVKLETLQTTKEPFVRVKEDEDNVKTFVMPVKADEAKLSLHAIVNGKAFINDQWLAPEEKIMGYTLKYVGSKGVVLRNQNNIKKLFLQKNKENNFIKLEERK